MEGRIIGGSLANIKNFPHCVYLSMACNDHSFACGASILNQIILLTAAHCVDECRRRKFRIDARVGVDDLDTKGGSMSEVSRFNSHSEYDEQTLAADICIMFLKNALPLGQYVRRVIIKPSLMFTLGDVAGWGIINDKKDEDTKLRSLSVKYVPKMRCAEAIGKLEKGMFCGRASNGKQNRPALGDSGSGLVTGNHQVVGLVSHSAGTTGYVIYTNVSHFYHWIMQRAPLLTCYKKLR